MELTCLALGGRGVGLDSFGCIFIVMVWSGAVLGLVTPRKAVDKKGMMSTGWRKAEGKRKHASMNLVNGSHSK